MGNQNYSLGAAWVGPNEEGGKKVPVGRGSCLIVCHVGSAQTGLIKECKLVFHSKGKKGTDYHSDKNAEVFTKWFENFLCTLRAMEIKNADIVMDNTSYHSVILNKAPTTSTKKQDIQSWLSGKEIPFTNDQTRAELLALVKLAQVRKEYALDRMAAEEGHTVVRLPPYHCQYNPIELVWSQVKRHVAERNNTFKMIDLEAITHEIHSGGVGSMCSSC